MCQRRRWPPVLPEFPVLPLVLRPAFYVSCFLPALCSQLARWTFKRSLLKCLEAAVLTTSDHRWAACLAPHCPTASSLPVCPKAMPLPCPTCYLGCSNASTKSHRANPADRSCLCRRLCRKEILASDGVGVIVRSCRWRPQEAAFKPKQEVGGHPVSCWLLLLQAGCWLLASACCWLPAACLAPACLLVATCWPVFRMASGACLRPLLTPSQTHPP